LPGLDQWRVTKYVTTINILWKSFYEMRTTEIIKTWLQQFVNGGRVNAVSLLTDHFKITNLTFHGIRVYLTHVPASIGLPYFPYVKKPRSVVTVGNRDPVILRDHVGCYRQNSLRIDTQPCHLKKQTIIIMYTIK